MINFEQLKEGSIIKKSYEDGAERFFKVIGVGSDVYKNLCSARPCDNNGKGIGFSDVHTFDLTEKDLIVL